MKEKSNNNIEMEVLFAEKEIELAGKIVVIKPFSWMESLRAAQPLGVLVKAVVQNVDGIDVALKSIGSKEQNILGQIEALANLLNDVDMESVIGALVEMMQLATKEPQEFIENLTADDAIVLGIAIYEVNKHFFTKRLAAVRKSGKIVKH